MRPRLAILLLAAVTALPRLAVLAYERGRILTAFTDKSDDFARTFVDSRTFGFIPGHPSAYTQPLYGWFLVPLYWILGRHWFVVGLAQIVVAVGTTIVVYEIGRRFVSPAAGLIAGIVVALHPYLVWHDVHMNREVLDHFLAALLVLLTLLAVRQLGLWIAIALGLVIGFAILGNVRLEAIPLVVGALLVWKHRRRALVPLAAMLGAAALVVMPWVGRNAASVGCWTVTTDSKALWKANNVRTLDTLRGGGWIDHVPQPRSFPPTPQDAYERWQRTGVVVPYDECAQMSMYQRRVLDFWRDHPGEKARLALFDATWLWQPSVVETRGRPGAGSWLDTLRRSAEPAYMIVLYALAIVGVFLVPRIVAIVAVSLLAYQTLTAMLFVGETRYRVPWDFLLALCAGACVVWLWERRPLWQRGAVVE